ncbi:uncharacterized protein VTP21DRAFT_10726 [Calcarisporiella thermophila]|uniref:uncharacterized protein n=1 Tax=Calcarisporiella thermophila TaxID=911321 RepID=UPI0037443A22
MMMKHSSPPPAQLDAASTRHSEEKYKQLKRKLKEVLMQNDKLSQDVTRAKIKVRELRKEKGLLLDRLGELEGWDSDSSESSASEEEPETALSPLANIAPPSSSAINKARKRPHSSPAVEDKRQKRQKQPIAARIRRVHPVERDENGNYKLPVRVGIVTVLNLGHIVYDREAYHNARYIFPVGYQVLRPFMSTVDPDKQVNYHCEVLDGGEAPLFKITPEDRKDRPIIAQSATGAWTTVVREANTLRKRDHSNSASGPDYYGFTHPTVAKMIQDLPGARQCANYVWQEFEEMEPEKANGLLVRANKKVNKLLHGPQQAGGGAGANGSGHAASNEGQAEEKLGQPLSSPVEEDELENDEEEQGLKQEQDDEAAMKRDPYPPEEGVEGEGPSWTGS